MAIFQHKSVFVVQRKGQPEVRVTIETDGEVNEIRRAFEQALTGVVAIAQPKTGWTFGLSAGKVWMSDDFDDELGDDFWFGEDSTL